MRPPKIIKPYVLSFCRHDIRVADSDPIYLACNPIDNSEPNNCFPFIEAHVKAHGGRRIIGWVIWERPKVSIEAEFHAVWESPSGELFDIVPRELPIPRILFLPDPKRSYDGFQVDNIRKPLTNDPNVKRFLDLAAQKTRIINKGDLREYYGEISGIPELDRVVHEQKGLEFKIIRKYGMWTPEGC